MNHHLQTKKKAIKVMKAMYPNERAELADLYLMLALAQSILIFRDGKKELAFRKAHDLFSTAIKLYCSYYSDYDYQLLFIYHLISDKMSDICLSVYQSKQLDGDSIKAVSTYFKNTIKLCQIQGKTNCLYTAFLYHKIGKYCDLIKSENHNQDIELNYKEAANIFSKHPIRYVNMFLAACYSRLILLYIEQKRVVAYTNIVQQIIDHTKRNSKYLDCNDIDAYIKLLMNIYDYPLIGNISLKLYSLICDLILLIQNKFQNKALADDWTNKFEAIPMTDAMDKEIKFITMFEKHLYFPDGNSRSYADNLTLMSLIRMLLFNDEIVIGFLHAAANCYCESMLPVQMCEAYEQLISQSITSQLKRKYILEYIINVRTFYGPHNALTIRLKRQLSMV